MNIARFCRENRYAVYLLTVFLVVAGFASIFKLPSNIYPELNFPRIAVLVHSGDLSPDMMLLNVTRPIEEAVSTTIGIRRVDSETIRGSAQIFLLFQPDMDMHYALQLVQAEVNEARAGLPADTQVDTEWESPVVYPVFDLILNGNVPDADLRDDAFYILKPLISRVQGVGIINVMATDVREVSGGGGSAEDAGAPTVAGGHRD